MGICRTFGLRVRGKMFNHRKEVRHKRFQDNIDPEEIVAKYSDELSSGAKSQARTFKDAQRSIGRKTFLLPNLSARDLELNELYQHELDRQRALIARVEKIKVTIESVPGRGSVLMMKKDISTPYDCALHLHEMITRQSVVAEILPQIPADSEDQALSSVDSSSGHDEQTNRAIAPKSAFWDMHRPLQDNCRIRFRHFAEKDVEELNKIYWRSCSFVLGMALRLAFKDNINVLLHSWPKPNVRSGSFIYDAALGLDSKWEPEEQELRAFTKILWDIKNADMPFDRLQVDKEHAKLFFSNNPFKLAQIDSIADSNGGKVVVYRCGGLLDLSVGPMISNTNLIGRITLAAVHPFETNSETYKGIFYRFQGVSLPQQLPLSSYLYQNVLISQAKRLNKSSL